MKKLLTMLTAMLMLISVLGSICSRTIPRIPVSKEPITLDVFGMRGVYAQGILMS